jgi:hypothetical protein
MVFDAPGADPGLYNYYLNPVADGLIKGFAVSRIDGPCRRENPYIRALNHIEHYRAHACLFHPDQGV